MGETAEETRDEGDTEIQDELGDVLKTIAAGFVATVLMAALLLALQTIFGEEFQVFRALADFAGASESLLLGVFLFFLGGTVAWPLLFTSIGTYLPGETRTRQGVVFAVVLWVSFVIALGRDVAGTDLIAFVVLTLALHAIYGYVLGLVSGRLTGDRVVSGPAV